MCTARRVARTAAHRRTPNSPSHGGLARLCASHRAPLTLAACIQAGSPAPCGARAHGAPPERARGACKGHPADGLGKLSRPRPSPHVSRPARGVHPLGRSWQCRTAIQVSSGCGVRCGFVARGVTRRVGLQRRQSAPARPLPPRRGVQMRLACPRAPPKTQKAPRRGGRSPRGTPRRPPGACHRFLHARARAAAARRAPPAPAPPAGAPRTHLRRARNPSEEPPRAPRAARPHQPPAWLPSPRARATKVRASARARLQKLPNPLIDTPPPERRAS